MKRKKPGASPPWPVRWWRGRPPRPADQHVELLGRIVQPAQRGEQGRHHLGLLVDRHEDAVDRQIAVVSAAAAASVPSWRCRGSPARAITTLVRHRRGIQDRNGDHHDTHRPDRPRISPPSNTSSTTPKTPTLPGREHLRGRARRVAPRAIRSPRGAAARRGTPRRRGA